jgi:PknH-like extracellular domain
MGLPRTAAVADDSPPLVERELTGLLLNPHQVNAAMGTTGMAVTSQQDAMSDNSATMAPPECLAIDGAAEAPVYADSGFWAERDQSLNNGDNFTHYLKQAVVLFPTIEKAAEFYTASAERWPACHEYAHTQSEMKWTVGKVSDAGGVLSVVAREPSSTWPARSSVAHGAATTHRPATTSGADQSPFAFNAFISDGLRP